MPGPSKQSLIKHLKPRRSALDHFVGRDKELDLFWDFFQNSANNSVKILNFYGVGGIGKSTLTQRIQLELLDKYPKTIIISLDFESLSKQNHDIDTVTFLEKFRSQISKKIPCYHFDLLYHYWWHLANPQIPINRLNIDWLDDSELLTGLLSITEDLPLIGLINKTIKVGWKGSLALKKWLATYGSDILAQLKKEKANEHDIVSLLPEQIIKDLISFLENQKSKIIVFIDGYEALWDNSYLRRQENYFQRDEWLRALIGELVTYDVLWLISGREALKWESLRHEGWTGYIAYRLITELPKQDALSLLQARGIEENGLTKEIIEITSGFPVLLDFFIDVYSRSIVKDKNWVVDEFKSSREHDLVSRFLRYLDQNERDTIFALACIGNWTTYEFEIIAKEITGYPITSYDSLIGFSFIFKEGEQEFSMHSKIAEHLSESWDNANKRKVFELIARTLKKEVESFTELKSLDKHQSNIVLRLLKIQWALMQSSEWLEAADEHIKLLESHRMQLQLAKLIEGFSLHTIEKRLSALLLNIAGNYYDQANQAYSSNRCYTDCLEFLLEEGSNEEILIVKKNKARALSEINPFDACEFVKEHILSDLDSLNNPQLEEVNLLLFEFKDRAIQRAFRFPDKIGLINNYLDDLIPQIPENIDSESLTLFNKQFSKLKCVPDFFRPYILKLLKFHGQYDKWINKLTSVFNYFIQCKKEEFYLELFTVEEKEEEKDDVEHFKNYRKNLPKDYKINWFFSSYIQSGLNLKENDLSTYLTQLKKDKNEYIACAKALKKYEDIIKLSLEKNIINELRYGELDNEFVYLVEAAFKLERFDLLSELIQIAKIQYHLTHQKESRLNLSFAYISLIESLVFGASLSRARTLLLEYYELVFIHQFASSEERFTLPNALFEKITDDHSESDLNKILFEITINLLSGDWDKSKKLFIKYFDGLQHEWAFRNIYGTFLIRTGDYQSAEYELLEANNLVVPNSDESIISRCNLSFLYEMQGKPEAREILNDIKVPSHLEREDENSIIFRVLNHLLPIGRQRKQAGYIRIFVNGSAQSTQQNLESLLNFSFYHILPRTTMDYLKNKLRQSYLYNRQCHALVSKMNDWGISSEHLSKFSKKDYLKTAFDAGFLKTVQEILIEDFETSEEENIMRLVSIIFLIEAKDDYLEIKQQCHDQIKDQLSLNIVLLFLDILTSEVKYSDRIVQLQNDYQKNLGVRPIDRALSNLLSIDHHGSYHTISSEYFSYLEARILFQQGQINEAKKKITELNSLRNERNQKFTLHLRCFELMILSKEKPRLARKLLTQLTLNLEDHFDYYHPIQIPILMDYISSFRNLNCLSEVVIQINHFTEIIRNPKVMGRKSVIFRDLDEFINEIRRLLTNDNLNDQSKL